MKAPECRDKPLSGCFGDCVHLQLFLMCNPRQPERRPPKNTNSPQNSSFSSTPSPPKQQNLNSLPKKTLPNSPLAPPPPPPPPYDGHLGSILQPPSCRVLGCSIRQVSKWLATWVVPFYPTNNLVHPTDQKTYKRTGNLQPRPTKPVTHLARRRSKYPDHRIRPSHPPVSVAPSWRS